MKFFLFLLACLTLTACNQPPVVDKSTNKAKPTNAEVYFQLHGQVKSVTLFDCHARKNKAVNTKECRKIESIKFDKQGNETEVISFYSDNKIYNKQVLTYKNGVYVLGKTFDNKGKLESTMKPTVINGQLIKVESPKQTVNFKYDKNGNRTLVEVKNLDGTFNFHQEMAYNSKGQITEKAINGKKEFFEYDDNGNIVKEREEKSQYFHCHHIQKTLFYH